MRLQVQGRVQTGVDIFDHALNAAAIWQDASGGPLLVVNSGQQGGLSTWRVLPSGQLIELETLAYSAAGMRAARDQLVLVPFQGQMVAFYGLGDTVFWGQVVNADGSFGAQRLVGFERAAAEIAAGNEGFLQIWAMMRSDAPPGLPDVPVWNGTTGVADVGGIQLAIGGADPGLRVLTAPAGPGLAGAALGIQAPTAMAVFDGGVGLQVVIAGSGGSSLSVLQQTPLGFVATEHLIDTATTAFARPQALAGVTVPTANGPVNLVFVGGSDHGVTVFAVLPDGALIWLDSLFDTALTGLHNIATLSATLQGDRVVVMATSERDAGITVLTLPLAGFGGVAPAGQGSAGADILVSGPGATSLTGGAGSDVFVIRAQQTAITISDFTPGQDRLDLSDWPMLRATSQLGFQSDSVSGTLSYRGYQVTITATIDRPLSLIDLFPRGLEGPDRVMVLAQDVLLGAPLSAEQVDPFAGTDGHDRILGRAGNDRLQGFGGSDTLYGGDGRDTIIGGDGDDFIFGGTTVDDLRDVIYGGDGQDSIDGGYGNDELHGGAGDDTLLGGFGSDTVIGNAGDDLLAGGAGSDMMFGGPGNDTLNGGFGYDRLNGGTGADRFFHLGVPDHASDWIQDYSAAQGDILVFGQTDATVAQFQVNTANTPNAGAANIAESFVIHRPTGQIMWALVDGDAQGRINIQLGGQVFDLLA